MSAQNKFTEREKKNSNNAENVEMLSQHEQNMFVLMETTQSQMPREKCQTIFFYENLQNGGHVNSGKNI